jgi:hypothetical protein
MQLCGIALAELTNDEVSPETCPTAEISNVQLRLFVVLPFPAQDLRHSVGSASNLPRLPDARAGTTCEELAAVDEMANICQERCH